MKPNWERLEADVVRKIHLLRAAWEHTEAATPELQPAMERDLYVPALRCLAAFCTSVEEK